MCDIWEMLGGVFQGVISRLSEAAESLFMGKDRVLPGLAVKGRQAAILESQQVRLHKATSFALSEVVGHFEL